MRVCPLQFSYTRRFCYSACFLQVCENAPPLYTRNLPNMVLYYVQILCLCLMCSCRFGFAIYYLVPLALLSLNLTLFFNLFLAVLLGTCVRVCVCDCYRALIGRDSFAVRFENANGILTQICFTFSREFHQVFRNRACGAPLQVAACWRWSMRSTSSYSLPFALCLLPPHSFPSPPSASFALLGLLGGLVLLALNVELGLLRLLSLVLIASWERPAVSRLLWANVSTGHRPRNRKTVIM